MQQAEPVHKSYCELAGSPEGTRFVDGLTCADLDLDGVFAKIDRTLSSPGQAILYHWIRNQCSAPKTLSRRRVLIASLSRASAPTDRIRRFLAKTGKQESGDIASEIWGQSGTAYMDRRKLFYGYYFVMLLGFAASLFFGIVPVFGFIGFSIINIIIHLRTTRYIGARASSIKYLGNLLALVPKFDKLLGSEKEFEVLGRLAKIASKIPKQGMLFQTNLSIGGDLVGLVVDYYRIFLLGELIAYFRFYGAFEKYREEIKAIFDAIGEIDAALSVSELEEDGGIVKALVREEAAGFRVEDAVHPLLPGCVGNSLASDKCMVITGTNMSGKTTFLRTMGINQVLATSIGLAYAARFETGFYHAVSSIKIEDSLLEGKSRYFFEAERLLLILRSAADHRVLALVDEILAGTNSKDRIAASIAIMRSFAAPGRPSRILTSTHNLEIAENLAGTFDAFYFTELISERELAFDYRLHPGIVDKRNAFRILEKLGFGEFIAIGEGEP